MRYEIVLAPEALEDLAALPAVLRTAVRKALELHLRHEPRKVSRSRIKRLRGLARPQFRLRAEDIRVFYDVEGDRVLVLAVVPKTGAAEWLGRWGGSK